MSQRLNHLPWRFAILTLALFLPAWAGAEELGGPFSTPEAPSGQTAGVDEGPSGLFGPGLHGRGPISAEYVYTADLFDNTLGGLNTTRAVRYRGLFDLAIGGDLDQLGWFPGGRVYFLAQNGHGQGPSLLDVGDIQYVSNIEAPDFVQMSVYRWEKTLIEDRLEVHLGKQDANEEFAVVEMAGHFIHSSFGFHPTIPMPTYPDPSMAAVLLWHPTEWLRLQGGVWDGQPDGRNWGFSGSGETFSIFEAELHYHLGRHRLPGTFHAGAWHHNGRWDDPAPGPPLLYDGNHGIHAECQQLLFREHDAGPDEGQGLGTFFQYGWSPADRNVQHQYFGAGLVWTGPIRNRDEDVLGMGMAHLIFSKRLPNQPSETAVELFYRAVLSPNVIVQPDLQFISNPVCSGRDALVAGVRMVLVL
ncbi:MAG: carbohydrate porin [Pirellulales bacterium]|nr:carbohydrate porin [Pirellulales bacterium]